MKNYPNQASTFERVRGTLAAITEVRSQGLNVLDDGVLGYALARRRIYTFRGFDYVNGSNGALDARIAQEMAKSSSNQGARTYARELRRTLIDLGWLLDDGETSPAGLALLRSEEGGDEERALLRTALLDLVVGDREGVNFSHPVVILLRLLERAPTGHRAGLELALEALDDSDAEIHRVLGLYDEIHELPSDERAARLGINEVVRANSTKIFPTLARYAGLVTEDQAGTWQLTSEGLSAIGQNPDDDGVAVDPPIEQPEPLVPTVKAGGAKRRRRLTRGQEKAADAVGQHVVNKTVPKGLTPDQQAEAQERLKERTDDHQALVRYFAKLVGDGHFHEDRASYDLAWVSDESDDVHLFEMKTIAADADAQVTRAIGQLLYYGHFNIVARFKAYPSTRTLVVDNDIHADLADFLETLGIGVLLVGIGKDAVALNPSGKLMLKLLPLTSVAS